MIVPEPPERRKLRHALRALKNYVASLDDPEYGFDSHWGKMHNIKILPMDLKGETGNSPIYFTPCPASALRNPDADHDRDRYEYYDFDSRPPNHKEPMDCARSMIRYFSYYLDACTAYGKDDVVHKPIWSDVSLGDKPFVGMAKYKYPEYLAYYISQVRDGSSPHAKAIIYNNLNGADGRILRGELMIALELSIAQLKRLRFMAHMTAPILLFSFLGPQHARLIEAYFDGTSLVVRPTKLFDFRTKNEAVIKTFGQWYFGAPRGNTEV